MKNLYLKNMLKGTVFPLISFLNKLIPKSDKRVLLYMPNTRFIYSLGPLKQYLLENGYDKKYKISYGNLVFQEDGSVNENKFAMVRSMLNFMISRHVFYTAGQLPIKPSKKQIVIHLQHGNATFKPLGKLNNIDNGDEYFFTYMAATSDLYVPIRAREYECPESCVKVVGDAMADALLKAPKGVYDFNGFDKVLAWAPTFRNSELMGFKDSDLNTLIPLFGVEDYQELNNILAKYNIRLIVKLHPIQTAPEGTQRHFSHLSIYSNDEFASSGYDWYTLIANSDGLIGDYSTVSMQYLLLDRPEAFVVPDIDDYSGNRGFIFNNPQDYMGGHIIKTKDEFMQFITDFANGKDVYREKRHWVCDQVFKYKDANCCERVVKLSEMSI